MNDSYIKLAKILRTKPEVLTDLTDKLTAITGKTGVIEKIMQENDILVDRTLDELGLDHDHRSPGEVYRVLVKRLEHLDEHLFLYLDKPDLAKLSHICGKLCDVAFKLADPKPGYFMKKEKAIELLSKYPPTNLLEHFGYNDVPELIEKHGFAPVMSSLRFTQSEVWMHSFFDDAYKNLTADDFEERMVEMIVLDEEWLRVAEKFLKKKHHNVSHLKELGIIFIVPIKIDIPGETMRMFTLLLHYLNEVPFYSKLIKQYAQQPDFVSKLQSLLRGDVPSEKFEARNSKSELKLRIVQRYLAKDDQNDFRLLEPHVNPEAEHWYRAEGDLGKLSGLREYEGHTMNYWQGLDFVGDFFQDVDGTEELIGFDLIDLVMSLVKKGEVKYLYHQEESLWNKIIIEYLGREKMNELIAENIIKGYITL